MTKLQNIRNELKNIIETIDGIGNVYPYYRYVKNDYRKTLELFRIDNDFKGLMIREVSCNTVNNEEDNYKIRKWELLMLAQVNDENESLIKFEEKIEELIDVINDNITLNNTIREHNNLQLVEIYENPISDVLCHIAILNLETIETI